MSDTRIILDTNIVSYLMKGGRVAEAYEPHVQNRLLAITLYHCRRALFRCGEKRLGRKEAESARSNSA